MRYSFVRKTKKLYAVYTWKSHRLHWLYIHVCFNLFKAKWFWQSISKSSIFTYYARIQQKFLISGKEILQGLKLKNSNFWKLLSSYWYPKIDKQKFHNKQDYRHNESYTRVVADLRLTNLLSIDFTTVVKNPWFQQFRSKNKHILR